MNNKSEEITVSDFSLIYSCLIFGLTFILNPPFLQDVLHYSLVNSLLGWTLILISALGFFATSEKTENPYLTLLNDVIKILTSLIPLLGAYYLNKYINWNDYVDTLIKVVSYPMVLLSLLLFVWALSSIKFSTKDIKFETLPDRIKAIGTLIPTLVAIATFFYKFFLKNIL